MKGKRVFHSDPDKDKLICDYTYKLMTTMRRLGLDFEMPMKEILMPVSLDGVMLDSFISAFIRLDDD